MSTFLLTSIGLADDSHTDIMTQIESFGEVVDLGLAGDNIGCLLRKTGHEDVSKGQVLAAADPVTPHPLRCSETPVWPCRVTE